MATLLKCSDTFRHPQLLRPEYSLCSLEWLLERASQVNGHARVQKVAVRNAARELIGWFLYCIHHCGLGEVLQIGSKKTSVDEVLDQLFHHAWRNGGVALRGRLEPALSSSSWSGLACLTIAATDSDPFKKT